MATKVKERITSKVKKPATKAAGKVLRHKTVGRSRHAPDPTVRSRISPTIKNRAGRVLHEIGLTPSDAIRLLMVRIAEDGAMPFNVDRPNAVSRAAIKDAEAGKVVRHKTVKSLMDDLNA